MSEVCEFRDPMNGRSVNGGLFLIPIINQRKEFDKVAVTIFLFRMVAILTGDNKYEMLRGQGVKNIGRSRRTDFSYWALYSSNLFQLTASEFTSINLIGLTSFAFQNTTSLNMMESILHWTAVD